MQAQKDLHWKPLSAMGLPIYLALSWYGSTCLWPIEGPSIISRVTIQISAKVEALKSYTQLHRGTR